MAVEKLSGFTCVTFEVMHEPGAYGEISGPIFIIHNNILDYSGIHFHKLFMDRTNSLYANSLSHLPRDRVVSVCAASYDGSPTTHHIHSIQVICSRQVCV